MRTFKDFISLAEAWSNGKNKEFDAIIKKVISSRDYNPKMKEVISVDFGDFRKSELTIIFVDPKDKDNADGVEVRVKLTPEELKLLKIKDEIFKRYVEDYKF